MTSKEWKKYKIADISNINANSYSSSENWKYANYLDTGNITKNKINEIQYIDLSVDKLPSRAKRKVIKNSIIYSTVRPNQQHFGFIDKQPENFLVSTGFAVIDVKPDFANPKFVYYYLTQEKITKGLHAIAEQSVSAYPSIKPSDIWNVKILLPPLEAQGTIASVLSSLDDKIELNNKINQNLEQQAQAIFKSWFVDFEPFGGKIPEDWEKSNLSEIANYLNGLAMQKYRPKNNEPYMPVLKIKELRQGFCDNTSDICTENINDAYIINNGDIIFSWSGSLLVDIWCGGKCGLNQHLFKVTSEKYNKWFCYLWTKYHLNKFIALASDMATTMGHIKRGELEKSKVIIPNNEDYQKINNIINPILNLIINNKIQNERLAQLRDTLLPKLMSGEINVDKVEV